MNKLILLSILLIVGCEEALEPEDACGVAGGDGTTCTDCAGVPNGNSYLDDCGGCDANVNNDCMQDCAGAWGGTAVVDECDVCGGDGSTCIVCADCGDAECCDCDGNIYETIQIGEQLWIAENLKVTHYNDGSEIPYASDGDGGSLSAGAYSFYNNDPSNADVYGNLYNWYTVDDDRDVCPDGWHVPSDEEFKELEMFLGMSEEEANSTGYRGTDEGSKLAGNSNLWNGGDVENNPEFGTSGFNGFPAGYRYFSGGGYGSMGTVGYFWSSSEIGITFAWLRKLNYDYSSVHRSFTYKQIGYSIRCLGD